MQRIWKLQLFLESNTIHASVKLCNHEMKLSNCCSVLFCVVYFSKWISASKTCTARNSYYSETEESWKLLFVPSSELLNCLWINVSMKIKLHQFDFKFITFERRSSATLLSRLSCSNSNVNIMLKRLKWGGDEWKISFHHFTLAVDSWCCKIDSWLLSIFVRENFIKIWDPQVNPFSAIYEQ